MEWEQGGRRGEPGRPSYPRHGSLPHAFRSQGTSRGQLGKRDDIEQVLKYFGMFRTICGVMFGQKTEK